MSYSSSIIPRAFAVGIETPDSQRATVGCFTSHALAIWSCVSSLWDLSCCSFFEPLFSTPANIRARMFFVNP